jgi:predicted GNAT family acetyltransferase
VATDEQYRNRGYATSIVSALVEEILKTDQTALIHVLRDNAPAARVCSKVGFKPYETYLSLKTDFVRKNTDARLSSNREG